MKNFNFLYFNFFFKELFKFKNKNFFISLGYRAAPIIISAILFGKRKNIFSYDERSLGFFALGSSKLTNIPSIIIVTSGTALGNLFPSLIEGYYSYSKMIILSSDRIMSKKDCGENQTIDQTKIYGNYVKKNFDIDLENFSFYNLKFLISTLRYVYQYCLNSIQGSIHLNFYISEPLHPVLNYAKHNYFFSSYFFNNNIKKYAFNFEFDYLSSFSKEDFIFIINLIKNAKLGLIIISKNFYLSDKELNEFLKFISFPVILDVSSNSSYLDDIQYINLLVLKYKSFSPDIVIFLGEKTIEKDLLSYLNLSFIKFFILFHNKKNRTDNNVSCNYSFSINIKEFINFLYRYKIYNYFIKKNFFSFFILNFILDKIIFQNKKINDFFIYKITSYNVKKNNNFFLSNSLCIRIFNLCWLSYNTKNNFFLNRGANGIDGLISSALGIAYSIKDSFFFFIGDISFLHDLNGLFFLRFIFSNIFIVLFNNNGCGIFTFLPIFNKKIFFFPYFEFDHKIKNFNFFDSFFLFERKIKNKKEFLNFFYCNLKNNRVNFLNIELLNNYNFYFIKLLNKYLKFYFIKDF